MQSIQIEIFVVLRIRVDAVNDLGIGGSTPSFEGDLRSLKVIIYKLAGN